ncbi:MAG: response regulator transcription factor [Paraburkholderia sp.]|jgi:two-component system OmpR family response regulator
MPKILTIEDDESFALNITRTLVASGFSVDVACTGREGMAKAMAGDYDIVTLARSLPDLDGLTILTIMRGVGMETPVLVLSAMPDIEHRIEAFRAGGDDYLCKPFCFDEISARIEALLRRRPRATATDTVLRTGELELDLVRRKVRRRERELTLKPTEFRVLEFMMRHPDQVLTREMIFEAVWGYAFVPGTNLIDVHIGRLRRKVHTAGERPIIRTIRGSGYLFG